MPVSIQVHKKDEPFVKMYPWIGTLTDNSIIVLFLSKDAGVTLKDKYETAPKYHTALDESAFIPCFEEFRICMKE